MSFLVTLCGPTPPQEPQGAPTGSRKLSALEEGRTGAWAHQQVLNVLSDHNLRTCGLWDSNDIQPCIGSLSPQSTSNHPISLGTDFLVEPVV